MMETKFIYVGMEPEKEARRRYKPVVDVADLNVFNQIDTVLYNPKKSKGVDSLAINPGISQAKVRRSGTPRCSESLFILAVASAMSAESKPPVPAKFVPEMSKEVRFVKL